jgi:hypothetical protein
MATVKIEVVAGPQTTTVLRTVTGPHLVRFITAYRGIMTTPGSPGPFTDEQVVTAWANQVFSEARDMVRQRETQAAVDTAVAAIVPIDFTV